MLLWHNLSSLVFNEYSGNISKYGISFHCRWAETLISFQYLSHSAFITAVAEENLCPYDESWISTQSFFHDIAFTSFDHLSTDVVNSKNDVFLPLYSFVHLREKCNAQPISMLFIWTFHIRSFIISHGEGWHITCFLFDFKLILGFFAASMLCSMSIDLWLSLLSCQNTSW